MRNNSARVSDPLFWEKKQSKVSTLEKLVGKL